MEEDEDQSSESITEEYYQRFWEIVNQNATTEDIAFTPFHAERINERNFLYQMRNHLGEDELRNTLFSQEVLTMIMQNFWMSLSTRYSNDTIDTIYNTVCDISEDTDIFYEIETTVDIYPATTYTVRVANEIIRTIKLLFPEE